MNRGIFMDSLVFYGYVIHVLPTQKLYTILEVYSFYSFFCGGYSMFLFVVFGVVFGSQTN